MALLDERDCPRVASKTVHSERSHPDSDALSLPVSRVKFRALSEGICPWDKVLFGPCGCLKRGSSPAQEGKGFQSRVLGAQRQGRAPGASGTGGTCKEAAACLPARDMRDPHMPTELRPRRRLIQVSPPWGSERTVAPVRDPGQWPQVPVCCYKAKSLAREQLSAGRSGELIPRPPLADAPTQQPLSSRAGLPHPERSGEAQDPALPQTGRATAAGPAGH